MKKKKEFQENYKIKMLTLVFLIVANNSFAAEKNLLHKRKFSEIKFISRDELFQPEATSLQK